MKKETKGKFTLEKFEIAKLRNQRVIVGGTGDDTQTDTTRPKVPKIPDNPNNPNNPNDPNDPDSSVPCQTNL